MAKKRQKNVKKGVIKTACAEPWHGGKHRIGGIGLKRWKTRNDNGMTRERPLTRIISVTRWRRSVRRPLHD